jgi:hypothetical protein
VRRRGTAKQRFWLGTDRYRGRCRNAGANANCFTNTCVERYAVWAVNANSYPDSFSYGHRHRYSHSAACNADTYSDTNTTIYRDTDANFTSGIANAYAQDNPKASSESASSAVKIG